MSQQLVKKGANGRMVNVNPKSWTEAIKDKSTGINLEHIIQSFNMYFLSYNGNTSTTRCLVPSKFRRKGLWITYVKYDGNVYTEWYAASEIDDKSWGDSSNWRIGNNTLVGDITISSNGNWVINGTETKFKAIGEKGNTPLIRVANNRFQVSYDLGDTYIDVNSNPVYTKFRWLATSGDTQANNVGRIQASTDEGKTWTNMSNDFTNNLHISRYIGINESLPTSGVAEGTIYAKGPYYDEGDTLNDNPIYRLWVYAWKDNTLAWQDNGEFTSIAAGVVQDTGDSETEVMSQKAVTAKLSELASKVGNIENETIETTDEGIIIQDNAGNEIIKVDSEGLDVTDLKIKGNKMSKSLDFTRSTDSNDEEQVWSNDEGTEEYAKIGKYGVKAKGFFDLDGNPLFENKTIKISCFGDSLTYGARASDNSKTSYPAVLKSLIGENCEVLNEGISGASCQQIMARMGAQSAFLKEDVVLNKTAWVYSDYELINGEGISIGKFSQGIPDKTVNPALINGIEIYFNTNGQLCRTMNAEEDVILRKGDAVIFNGCRRNIDSDILCLWMGTNGVYSSIEKLAEYYKNSISALGVTKYLILGMTYVDSNKNISVRKAEENYLSSVFGVHYINLRDYLSKYSLIDANITPTDSDNQLMANGEMPNSIMGTWEQGVDRIHFNDIGYELIARQVFERGKILKYWF